MNKVVFSVRKGLTIKVYPEMLPVMKVLKGVNREGRQEVKYAVSLLSANAVSAKLFKRTIRFVYEVIYGKKVKSNQYTKDTKEIIKQLEESERKKLR
ncbi:MAG: hypothetical protein HZB99_00335 [Candidatus Harrisonbacteria bacterium]|nr:hypothetical protein [Candidatus Harrisonbacteria bacterium]